MRALRRIHLAALLAPRVVHGDASLRALHEDHEHDGGNAADQHQDGGCRRHLAVTHQLRRARDRSGHARNDSRENDHRDAVADTALGNLLTEPHQEHRSRNQRDARGDQETRSRVDHEARLILQPGSRGDRLEARQCHGTPAGVLDNLAPTLLTFFTKLLQAGHDMARHLHDDR